MFVHAQAPIRVGIAGGGTDLPAWTRERTGHCISLAIDTYTHAVGISRSDGRAVASYAGRLDDASCATEIANGLVRESALMHGFEDDFEVHTLSEMSSKGSGLGVSSSIAVSLAACFSRMASLRAGDDGVADVMSTARDAWVVEIERLRRSIGRQDHVAAANGGLRLYRFEQDSATIERTFSEEQAGWVAARLALLKLPYGHDARKLLSGVTSPDDLMLAYAAVQTATRAIVDKDLLALGKAIRMGHDSKKHIPGAVPPSVASLVFDVGRVSGVYGCKIAGAGGGGHLVVVYDGLTSVLANLRAFGMPVITVRPDFRGVRSEGIR